MATGFLLTTLYLATSAALAAVARWLRRPLPAFVLTVCTALPILFLLPGFATERTILPVDHALAFPPWKTSESPFPRNPNLNDVATQFLPWAKAVRLAWKDGELPLRDRWNGCGMPLAGNGTSAAFSPLSFLMLALPLARAFTLAAAVKLLLALCGTWLWLRELDVGESAALLGAVAFSFSLTMTPWLLFPQSTVIALWPWAFLCIERQRSEDGSRRAFALLVAVFAVWPLCGHLESVASGAAFGAVWLAARWAFGGLPDAARVALRTASAALLALGLSAFAFLPQAHAIAASNRLALADRPFFADNLSLAPHGPAWPKGLLMPLVPKLFGDPLQTTPDAGAAASFPEMALGSIGWVAWVGALLALRLGKNRRPAELAFGIALLCGLGVAVGQWPFAEIAAVTPGLRWMFPLRFFSWVALSGAALAALGIDRLGNDLSGRRMQRLLPLAFAALCALELARQGRRFHAFGSPGDLFPDRPLAAFLRKQPGVFRVVGEEAVLFPNTNVFAGIEDVRTHDPVERRDYVLYLDRACGYNPADYFKHIRNLNCAALDTLNVRYLVVSPGQPSPGQKWKPVYAGADGAVFENVLARPRVSGPGAEVSDYQETTNSATFRARIVGPGSGILAVSLVQDGGWSAMDGAGQAVVASRSAEDPFLSLTLPPGDHTVRLTYRPPGWHTGVAITLATIAGLAIGSLLRSRRKHPLEASENRVLQA